MLIDFSARPKVTLDFTQRVFLSRTHSYILVRKGDKYGHFLTMASGMIDLVRIPHDDAGGYAIQKRNEGEAPEGYPYVSYPLQPYPKTSLRDALAVYWQSTLSRSTRADAALRELTGRKALPSVAAEGPARRKLPAPRPAAAAPKTGGGVSLQTLCAELGVAPADARKLLRQKGVAKPGDRWEWANRTEAKAAIQAISA